MNNLTWGKIITVRAVAVRQGDILPDGGRVGRINRIDPKKVVLHVRYVSGEYGESTLDNDYAVTVTRTRKQSADVAGRLGAYAHPPLAAGYSSQAVRVSAPSAALRWFMTLASSERGQIVLEAWLEALPALERMRARHELGLK